MRVLGGRLIRGQQSLVRGTRTAFVLRITALGLNFIATFVLARFLSPSGFGAFAWSLAIVSILRLLVSGGFDLLIVREAATAMAAGGWSRLRGILEKSTRYWLLGSLLSGVVIVAGARLLRVGSVQERAALTVAVLALPALAVLTGRQAVIQGIGAPGTARVGEDLVLPATFVFLVAADRFLLPADKQTVGSVVARVAAAWAALLVAYTASRRRLPPAYRLSKQGVRLRSVLGEALPMLAVTAFNAIIADIGTAVVGVISSGADAGVYAAASRLAALVGLAELAVNAALAPVVVTLYKAKRMEDLRTLLTRNVRIMATFAFAVGVVLLILAPQLLGLFGHHFRSGAATLRILVVGWELNVFAGAASLVLVMTGRQRVAAKGLAAGIVVNIPAAFLLVPVFGMVGAAWASLVSVALWNLILLWYVRRKDGVDASVMGRHAAQ